MKVQFSPTTILIRFGILVSILLTFNSQSRADYQGSNRWFSSLSDEQRVQIQTDLTLTGFYSALVDGTFGQSTYRALVSFQESTNTAPTGILDSKTQSALESASSTTYEQMGMEIVQDSRGQLELAVPRALLPQTIETSVGTGFTRPDDSMRLDTIREPYASTSYDNLYILLSKENSRRNIRYKTFQESFFVVSGSVDGEYFYTLMFEGGDESVGFTLRWSEVYRKQGSILSLFLASYAQPLDPQGKAPPNQKPGPPSSGPPQLATAPQPSDPVSEDVTQVGQFLIFKSMPGAIGLTGEISSSTPLDFRRALKAASTPKVLILASDGGYVASALLLAYEVHEMGLATYILPDTGCYSACSFIFLAGSARRADGKLGVHQVWSQDADASTAQSVVSDILEAFADFGVKQEVTSAMLRTVPSDMHVFTVTELEDWGINYGNPMAEISQSWPKSSPDGAQPTEDSNESSNLGKSYVLLSSQRTEDDARTTVVLLLSKYYEVFGEEYPTIQKIDLGDKGVYYRVVLASDSEFEASQVCDQVKKLGGDCDVIPH